MNVSIKTKLLSLCILLVLVITLSISSTYYVLTRQDAQRESEQRIQIAFDIILNDFNNRAQTSLTRFDEFLKEDTRLLWAADFYHGDESSLSTVSVIAGYFVKAVENLKKFGHIVAVDRLALYGDNTRLLMLYQRHNGQETSGLYVKTETGQDTFLSADNIDELNQILMGGDAIPEIDLPTNAAGQYEYDIPDTISADIFHDGRTLGIRVVAPVYHKEVRVGVLIGDMLYTQAMLDQYAALSKTDVNFFAGHQFSLGTLPEQASLDQAFATQFIECAGISEEQTIAVAPRTVNRHDYYQGGCSMTSGGQHIGAVTVSLSQAVEQQAIQKMLTSVLIISLIAVGLAVGLSMLFSRKAIRTIDQLVKVIGAAAEGDLRKTAPIASQDEFGILAARLNKMILQLRTISDQIQQVSHTVHGSADGIRQQMGTLTDTMHHQLGSVDNTTESIEEVQQFIDAVARNTTELLASAEQILATIQEMRASTEEVTTSTKHLTLELQRIVGSVDQVDLSMTSISEHTGNLDEIAQQTETESRHINESLQEVSVNAEHTQQLAQETMEAALAGQASVDASLEGMQDLKAVVGNTAHIIQEVNSWGERVSSILDIVDDITGQTSLLALNASIISAQAGTHGRGFAIVADEIKNLAIRTKTSTKEIATLVHELQIKTEEGVKHTAEGLERADQEMQLTYAVKDALGTILERATNSSNRASDTVQVIRHTTERSRAINGSMTGMAEMVSTMKHVIHEQEQGIEQVVGAVENISGMSEQVNRATLEQKRAADEIVLSMGHVTEQFSAISRQTDELQQNSSRIVAAMQTIKSATAQTLRDATTISGDTVNNLLQQSERLRKIVTIFKIR